MSEKEEITNKSPFPGMDPYLEGEMWPEFHQTLANQIRTQLMPLVRPKYVALLEKHYAIDEFGLGIVDKPSKQSLYPDIHVTKIKERAVDYETFTAPAVELVSPLPVNVPILNVEIRDLAKRRLVTVIEILSPANKRGTGFQKYLRKRAALLQSTTHFLELDLLRIGQRIPLLGGKLPAAPYYVFLSRSTNRPHTGIWPIQFHEPLPTVPVPLLSPDSDVPLALQAAIDACFELVRYHEGLLDYNQPPPPPPLNPEDLEWVESVVKSYADG
jgi:hypothetical protein